MVEFYVANLSYFFLFPVMKVIDIVIFKLADGS
jgi:hypothetical protein